MRLQPLLLTVDRISAAVGKLFAWLIVVLTGAICYEVFARYLFRAPTTWAFDVSYMLYGTLFMCAGAYTLSRNGHVRADFMYRLLPPRRQAALDLALYILFFFPAMLALVWFGWQFFEISFHQNERSAFSPEGPLIWPFKFVIPAVGVLMLLQGAAETARCVICLRQGHWPPKLSDVEEMEVLTIKRAAMLRAEGDAHP
ncbi:TRAP transporter small permease subunit [Crenalkalicoccus roseus]|uniref:TRAP transporter small permease subunit n=1 Tax=Crenalkalicoccus roseus TaxID=1485588 RepID=UPI001F020D1B|nr:TRAP transporter small permease subunit [Crenalkalicoccus roseus]